MPNSDHVKYLIYDTESVPDGELISRVLYPQEGFSAEAAIARYQEELKVKSPGMGEPFLPLTFQIPVAISIAKVNVDLEIVDLVSLDKPSYRPPEMVKLFWKGLDSYKNITLVDFNGRGFDIPLLSMSAFRWGISCKTYFGEGRNGLRNRYYGQHLDLMEWFTNFRSFRMTGGLNLLSKMLGKPGKMGVKGEDVPGMYQRGEVNAINDYCMHDVLDTYFVFLRTCVLKGQINVKREQELVEKTRVYLEAQKEEHLGLSTYLDQFGLWKDPFQEEASEAPIS